MTKYCGMFVKGSNTTPNSAGCLGSFHRTHTHTEKKREEGERYEHLSKNFNYLILSSPVSVNLSLHIPLSPNFARKQGRASWVENKRSAFLGRFGDVKGGSSTPVEAAEFPFAGQVVEQQSG